MNIVCHFGKTLYCKLEISSFTRIYPLALVEGVLQWCEWLYQLEVLHSLADSIIWPGTHEGPVQSILTLLRSATKATSVIVIVSVFLWQARIPSSYLWILLPAQYEVIRFYDGLDCLGFLFLGKVNALCSSLFIQHLSLQLLPCRCMEREASLSCIQERGILRGLPFLERIWVFPLPLYFTLMCHLPCS